MTGLPVIGARVLAPGEHLHSMASHRCHEQHSNRQEQETDPKLFLQAHTVPSKMIIMDAFISPAAIC
jgi:hypothetical protein